MRCKAIVVLALIVAGQYPGANANADTFGSGANTFDIEFVTIGNPGNASDPGDGDLTQPGTQHFGSVPYEYRMGKFEISEDMIDKAGLDSTQCRFRRTTGRACIGS